MLALVTAKAVCTVIANPVCMRSQTAALHLAQASPLPPLLPAASDAALATLCGQPLTFVKGEEQEFRLGVNL